MMSQSRASTSTTIVSRACALTNCGHLAYNITRRQRLARMTLLTCSMTLWRWLIASMNDPDTTRIDKPDLRILALIDSKLLPPVVQQAFDQWRIFKARDAVVSTVKAAMQRRLLKFEILE